MQETGLISRAKVELMGRQYTLKGDVDLQYMITLAEYINQKLKEMKEMAPQADPTRLALLMSLNLADELFQARNQPADNAELDRLQEKTRKLVEMLEEGLIGEY